MRAQECCVSQWCGGGVGRWLFEGNGRLPKEMLVRFAKGRGGISVKKMMTGPVVMQKGSEERRKVACAIGRGRVL